MLAAGGNDTFTAGSGSLDVTAGAGKDAYVFRSTSGLLTLEDFSLAKGDTLTIDKALQGSLHEAADGKGGTMLSFGANTGQGVDFTGWPPCLAPILSGHSRSQEVLTQVGASLQARVFAGSPCSGVAQQGDVAGNVFPAPDVTTSLRPTAARLLL